VLSYLFFYAFPINPESNCITYQRQDASYPRIQSLWQYVNQGCEKLDQYIGSLLLEMVETPELIELALYLKYRDKPLPLIIKPIRGQWRALSCGMRHRNKIRVQMIKVKNGYRFGITKSN